MYLYIKLFFFGILISNQCYGSKIYKLKAAVIGGGIGGASASHFLTELFKDTLQITLFEPHDLGGRLANIEIGENKYEAGGSVIHTKNKYMQDFVQLLGLKKKDISGNTIAGIWNGEKFVFEESKWKAVTLMKILYRYGFELFKLNSYVNGVLSNFSKIYNLQDNGIAFENLPLLLSALNFDFPELLNVSIKDHLQNMGFSTTLIDELIESAMVTNYGQETNVHSFVGYVSLAGAGSELWSVEEGNRQVPEKLIRRNNNVKIISSRIEKIRFVGKNETSLQYELFYRNRGNPHLISNVYDIVIIATPLTDDQENPIYFENIPNEVKIHFPGKYQTTIATFVQGNLNTHHFGLENEIDAIFSCNPNKTRICSIGKQYPISDSKMETLKTWKVFTRETITASFINKIFSQIGEIKEKRWKAYPLYTTENRFDQFKLFKGLYHVNAIEWAASAMEMSAVGGRNVAILAYKDFYQKFSKTDVIEKRINHFSEL